MKDDILVYYTSSPRDTERLVGLSSVPAYNTNLNNEEVKCGVIIIIYLVPTPWLPSFDCIDDVERSLITYLRIGGEANFARHVREAGMAKCKLFLISEITLQLN